MIVSFQYSIRHYSKFFQDPIYNIIINFDFTKPPVLSYATDQYTSAKKTCIQHTVLYCTVKLLP